MLAILNKLFSSENTIGKFEFLDGFRGSLVLWVVMHHCAQEFKINTYFIQTGYFIGVIGFFILSSFLLTYRLLDQFKNSNNSPKSYTLIIIKYSIRRLFRIYIPFVIVTALITQVPAIRWGGGFPYNTFWKIITLKSTGNNWGPNPLWTIAPEIKYYFFIPVYSLLVHKLMLNTPVYYVNMLLISLAYVVQEYKIFDYLGMVDFELVNGHLFGTRFIVFYLGSMLATFYYQFKLAAPKQLNELLEQHKHKLTAVTVILYIIGMIIWSARYNLFIFFNCMTFLSALYWTCVLGLMLVGAPNLFTNLFNWKLLKYGGKFSFGIYLFHSMCIYYIRILFVYILNRYSWEIVLVLLASSYLCGFLFFYLCENLLMKLANYLIEWISGLDYFNYYNSNNNKNINNDLIVT